MTAAFGPAFAKLLADEGGLVWSNRAADRGGETFAGIARRWHEPVTRELWAKIDACKNYADFPACLERPAFHAMIRPFVADFYRTTFWNALGLHELHDQRLAGEIFDIAVNNGKRVAATIAQQAVNACNHGTPVGDITVDGRLGPVSRRAINALAAWSGVAAQAMFVDMNVRQGLVYQRIIEGDPGQKANYRGWLTKRVLAR